MRPIVGFANGASVLVTTRDDGDQRRLRRDQLPLDDLEVAPPGPGQATATLVDRDVPWTFVRQVHGGTVVNVEAARGPMEIDADGMSTRRANLPLAVLGADCSLIALGSTSGAIAAVHAGWKGLLSGVVEAGVAAVAGGENERIEAVIGPTIGAECYEFSPGDLDPFVARYGEAVVVKRPDGSVGLDLVAGVRAALIASGVDTIVRVGGCTSCDDRFYSWRARREDERHALVVWRDADA